MKHASYLVQHALPGVTPHAEECLKKIRSMLPEPKPAAPVDKSPEREPGSDDEGESAW